MNPKKQPEIDVIFDTETIADRIDILAEQIAKALPDDLLIIVVLKGSFIFAADLLRAPIAVDTFTKQTVANPPH